jgi:hypothetical protein
MLKQRYQRYLITIENLYKILITVIGLIFFLHLCACSFIAIGHISTTDQLNSTQWIERSGIEFGQYRQIYVTALYFTTTTITTIGYGDYSGVTVVEKLFIIFLLFAGILCFTLI